MSGSFKCGGVSSQKGRSIRRCLFGAFFDQGVVLKVWVLQSAGYVFWGPAKLGVTIVEFVFASFGVIERLGVSERFLVIFREIREDFLSLTAAFESSGLELLVRRWRDLRRIHATRGGLDFGGGVIVGRLGARKRV